MLCQKAEAKADLLVMGGEKRLLQSSCRIMHSL